MFYNSRITIHCFFIKFIQLKFIIKNKMFKKTGDARIYLAYNVYTEKNIYLTKNQ